MTQNPAEAGGLVSIIQQSESLEVLIGRLIKAGFIKEAYSDRRRFVDCIKRVYACYGNQRDSSSNLSPLPGRVVNTAGVTYFIHGIIHRTPRKALKREYKEALRGAIAGWSILCEDGLEQGIFPEADIFGEWEALGLHRIPYLVSFSSKMILLGVTTIIDRLKKENPRMGFIEIETIDDLRDVRIELFRSYLPEPLGMNSLLYMYPSSTRVKRYVFEAEKAIRYAHERGLRELHIIVGCDHELPLEYLLTHQEKIQDFKSRIGALTK